MKVIKNNKGISLISVVVTLVLMIVILSSIIFSQSRSKEIKEAMAINRDIEELNKKVEIYYYENRSLPLDEKNRKFMYYETIGGERLEYYRLRISLFDNLTLNNTEIVEEDAINLDESVDKQWYIINPQTHLIYFVKNENGEINVLDLNYNKKYSTIVDYAKDFVDFDREPSEEVQPTIDDTTITPQADIKSNNEVSSRAFEGNNENPQETTGVGKYDNLVEYIGYTYEWTPGTAITDLLFHFDAISNYYNNATSSIEHSTTTNLWYDLSGHSNSVSISDATWSDNYLSFDSNGQINGVNSSGVNSNYTLEIVLSYDEYISSPASIAKVQDNGTATYYYNGNELSSQGLEENQVMKNFIDGLVTNSTLSFFEGMKIYSMRVYNAVLSENQIINNFNVDSQRFMN